MKKLLFCFIIFPLLSHAKVTLPSILGDNMVLQQQSDVKLWGKAKAGKKITVRPSWTNKQFQTVVNSDGRWLLHISTPKAGGPYEIKIKDEDEIILKNILIGEVWFCSGQSNMEMPVRGFEFEPVDGANDIIAMSNESTPIRIYSSDFDDKGWFRQYSKTPLEDCKGQWMTNTVQVIIRAPLFPLLLDAITI
jgi:sialate O-acetylesterase